MGFSCDLCRLAVTVIAEEISKNTSVDDLASGIGKLSSDIFGEGSSQFSDFVSKHLPEIIHYLDQGLTPEDVCRALALCE